MRKQETADSAELESIVGKPTPGTRYTPMKNPAIPKLLEFYHMDVQSVINRYQGLTVLKWINMGPTDFANLVYKHADRMKRKMVAQELISRPADETPLPDPDEEMYDEEQDCGAVTVLRKKLRVANAEKKKMESDRFLYRKLVEGTKDFLGSVKPDHFNITYSKVSKVFEGKKFYNILPISDVHWGEVIVPERVNYGNEYNFEISKRRHIELFRKNQELAKMYGCDEVNIFMLGDILAGNIHDELRESAETTICDAMARYISFFTGLVTTYAKEFKNIEIFCVVGNHARVTKEPRYKKKGIDNYEYTLYRFLETYFNSHPDLHVHVHTTEGTVLFAKVGDQTWKLEHGDSYRGGTAFAAPIPSVTRDGFKDKMMYSDLGYEYDASIIGHFHIGAEHFISGNSAPIYINPSIVGPGEYSMTTCHSSYPASSFMFITDGKQVIDRKFVNLQGV